MTKSYNYSFAKVFLHYWYLFVIPIIVIIALIKIDYRPNTYEEMILTILGSLPGVAVLLIPLIAIFILVKTKITINERHLIRKRFNKTTKIEWNKVSSIERVKKYTITFDEPKDLKITTKDGKDIYIYGYLENFNNAIEDIKRYSGIEF